MAEKRLSQLTVSLCHNPTAYLLIYCVHCRLSPGCLTEKTNFRTIFESMSTLFGVATGDGVTCLVHACMVSEAGKSWSVKGACSEVDGTCGEPRNARLFFLVFDLIITFTTMELFVNVVLDRFEHLSSMKGRPITLSDFEEYTKIWASIDNDATGRIPVTAVPKLLELLQSRVHAIGVEELAGEEPIRLHELRLPEQAGGKISRWLCTRNPDEADESYLYLDPDAQLADAPAGATVHFKEVLYGLCEKKQGCPMPRDNDAVDEVRREIGVQLPTVQ